MQKLPRLNRLIPFIVLCALQSTTASSEAPHHASVPSSDQKDSFETETTQRNLSAKRNISVSKEDQACFEKFKSVIEANSVTLTKDALVYHWFPNERDGTKPLINPKSKDYQERIRQTAVWKASRFWNPDPSTWNPHQHLVGAGLYAATDPIATMKYGGTKGNGTVIKMKLKAGMKFLNLHGPAPDVSPECQHGGWINYERPDPYLPLFQAAFQELNVSGVIYKYEAVRYDSYLQTSKFAFDIIDAEYLNHSELEGIEQDLIAQDSSPKKKDRPETLYYKYNKLFTKPFNPLQNKSYNRFVAVKSSFDEWAKNNIISMSSMEDFTEPSSPKKPPKQ